jgi:proline iminopeptidase
VSTVEINGTELFHTRIGRGTPALVLHGGLGVDQNLYRSLDPLGDRLELVYYDHRGNGRSGRPDPSTLTMEQWADDAAALAARLFPGRRFIGIGHSFGGFIAQELAIRHSQALAGLILVSTTPGQLGAGEDPAPEGPPPPPEFIEVVSTPPETDEEYATGMRRLLPVYFHGPPPDEAWRLIDATVFDAATMRRGFEVLASWSAVDRLGGVDVPTLVVAGRNDAITAAAQGQRIAARLPDAEVVVLEDSAHFPWMEEPAAFFEAVREWLDRRQLA